MAKMSSGYLYAVYMCNKMHGQLTVSGQNVHSANILPFII